MKKVKVMNIIYSMDAGGAQQVVTNIMTNLNNDNELDMILYVYESCKNSKYDQILKDNNVKVTYLNAKPKTKSFFHLASVYNYFYNKKLWTKVFRNEKPDIVHIHISNFISFTLPAIKKNKIPVKFDTLHSNPLRQQGKILWYIKRAFQKEGFIPICLNNEQAILAKKHYGFENYEIVYNGIDIENIKSNIISKKEAREKYDIPEDAFVVLGVGRLNVIKRYDLLIQIFFDVIKKNDNSLLVLAGDGPEMDSLKHLADELNINDKIRFLGNQINVIPLYCLADVFVMTSTSEASPMVLLEAQLCKTRSVISNGVPSESIVTNIVKKMDKDASIEEWSKALLNDDFKGEIVADINRYEIHQTTLNMKNIYLKYWKEFINLKKK